MLILCSEASDLPYGSGRKGRTYILLCASFGFLHFSPGYPGNFLYIVFWLLQNKMDSHMFSVLPQILLLMYEVTPSESNFLLKEGPLSCHQREDRQWYVNQIAQ